MKIETVGIIGYGHFGQFIHMLAGQFFPEITVKVHSRHMGIDGELFVSFEEACQSDIIIMCAAISDYEEQIIAVAKAAPQDSILIDVATVKKFTSELLRKHADGRKFISTHPMFGPESYQKHSGSVQGFRIVVTDYVLTNDEAVQLKDIFASLGFLVVEMTADEHDKLLANSLFFTHYIAQTVGKLNIKRTNMDTLSFQFLMDAVESVIDDAELFQDVYRHNPYCKDTAKRIHEASEQVFEELQKST